MLQDRPRVEAYAESMRRTVRPGDVVVDIGCGTGYFSLLACQLGARRVYALEPLEAIELARECARASGFDNRITFIRDLSTRVDLPEKADVIVSDLRGALPPHTQHLPSLLDARARLLSPTGHLICQRDTLIAALADYVEGHDRCVRVWDGLAGVDQRACKEVAANSRVPLTVDCHTRLGPPRAWAAIDYRQHTAPHVSGCIRWNIEQPFRAHGIGQWFEADLAGGVRYSNGPDHPGTPAYNRMFFPWPEEMVLAPGDTVEVRLEARLIDVDYVWSWDSVVRSAQGLERVRFEQSSVLDRPLPGLRLERRSPQFSPTLDEEGQATRSALCLMDGQRTQHAIANELVERFPRRFLDINDALNFVTHLSLKFS